MFYHCINTTVSYYNDLDALDVIPLASFGKNHLQEQNSNELSHYQITFSQDIISFKMHSFVS